jgi:malate dehydrogenase
VNPQSSIYNSFVSVVAIVGAGELGGALAHRLAVRGCVREIRLIDDRADVAAGKALDIQQAGAIDGFATRLRSASDIMDAAGADVVAIADAAGAPGREHGGDAALAVLGRLARLDDDAVLICAGASQRELVERGVRELKIPRARLLGTAPGALVGAVQAMVALEARGAARDVSVAVLGTPPAHTIVAWEAATIAGFPIARVLDAARLARLSARVPRLWPPGPHALASAAAHAAAAIVSLGRRRLCCFVVLDGELGVRNRAAALPAILGTGGIVDVQVPPLSVQERVLLDNALAAV